MHFSIKYRYSDILLKKQTYFIPVCFAAITLVIVLARFLRGQHHVNVTSVPHYQSIPSMYAQGMIPRNCMIPWNWPRQIPLTSAINRIHLRQVGQSTCYISLYQLAEYQGYLLQMIFYTLILGILWKISFVNSIYFIHPFYY